MMPSPAAGALVILLAALLRAPGAPADTTSAPVPANGDYRSRPVFYERFFDTAGMVGDELDLLRVGQVRLQHYAPVDVTRYAWERDSFTEYTWWMQMQELRFLLPAIASTEPGDRRLAREWFMRWYAVHMVPAPATGTWGEPMTVAYRAMVLVLFLKTEATHKDSDASVLGLMRSTLLDHQRYLSREKNFDDRTNHGLIAALGLFETTRVLADTGMTALAAGRIQAMVDRAVSPGGVEKEHSAGYHFTMMQWIEQIAAYLGSLPSGPPELVASLSSCATRMRAAGYFLQDHAGVVVPIGDTDSVAVAAYSPAYRIVDAAHGDALFDPASGYAIHKGAVARGDCRHVVFRIPGGTMEMRSHCHADALAVLFSHAGETILGDAGRYSYGSDPIREYCVSPSAHSTLMPYPIGPGWYGRDSPRLVDDAADLTNETGSAWFASLTIGGVHYRRTVRIPAGTNTISVVDSIVPATEHSPAAADAVLLWNLGVDVTDVRETPGRTVGEHAWLLTTRGGQRLFLGVTAAGPGSGGVVDARLFRGQAEPRLGWYSPSQGVLRPASTLAIHLRCAPTLVVTTDVEIQVGACASGSGRTPGR